MSNEHSMNVYVPRWMSEDDGDKVREVMGKVVAVFSDINNPYQASVLVYAMTNLCVGILKAGQERADKDQEYLVNVFALASGASALINDALQSIVDDMSEDTLSLLGEPEGTA